MAKLHIIGGGLAGCEAAWQASRLGVSCVIHEMRGVVGTAAHKTDVLAELVCSNSFRSDDAQNNAVGLLHEEMRRLGSLILSCGDANQVPAGGALAVDRDGFALAVQAKIEAEPLIEIRREEVLNLPEASEDRWIIATGPLTGSGLADAIARETGREALAFFDAIAPIMYKDSIDFSRAWFQSRYDKVGPGGDGKDYINCGLSESEYNTFIDAILEGEKTSFHEWEKSTPYFEGCMPIETMAERGRETPRFGPMKPVGLTNPHSPEPSYAVVQLRQDNALGTLYNMVGFQTKLTYSEQKRVFRMIPGLEQAEFARLGGLHRNTFINSPSLLDAQLRLHSRPDIRFSGQITGCEGYVESAAMGGLAGRFAAWEILGEHYNVPPPETAHGALLSHITGGANKENFQPMNINFGLFPPLAQKTKKILRKPAMSTRALNALENWQDSLFPTVDQVDSLSEN